MCRVRKMSWNIEMILILNLPWDTWPGHQCLPTTHGWPLGRGMSTPDARPFLFWSIICSCLMHSKPSRWINQMGEYSKGKRTPKSVGELELSQSQTNTKSKSKVKTNAKSKSKVKTNAKSRSCPWRVFVRGDWGLIWWRAGRWWEGKKTRHMQLMFIDCKVIFI